MTGAVLTKSTKAKHTYAGIPAKDVTGKLNFWRELSLDVKFDMLKGFVQEFLEIHPEYEPFILIEPNVDELMEVSDSAIAMFKKVEWQNIDIPINLTVFDLSTKTYKKRNSLIEIAFMRFNVGFKARFTPRSREVNEK